MKLRTLLPSIIFLIGALSARAQITQMYYQGFENGDNVNYSADISSSLNYSSTIYMSGQRALKLDQPSSGEVTLVLDTLDFTQDALLRYVSLEFDHICAIRENNGDIDIARIYAKRPNQNTWTQLTSQHYNTTSGTASEEFPYTGVFNRNAYDEWVNNTTSITNNLWKSERFDLNNFITPSLAMSERKLLIKFVLKSKNHNNVNGSWYIDNIKINSSQSLMVRPVIEMKQYPEAVIYPSSRGARISLKATTSVAEGINPDSVYLFYRIGSSPVQHRMQLSPISGQPSHYTAYIPFQGYDTSMYFYCVVRDATTNANMVTFPLSTNAWVEYKCVRGQAQPGLPSPGFTGTSAFTAIPFPGYADTKSEWVYDSALLAAAGYGPGSITALTFTLGANVNANLTRPSFRLKMKNVPTDYVIDQSTGINYFTSSYMHTVYDAPFTINSAILGSSQTIQLQDTFHYAGKDILIQASYDDNVNGTSTSLQMIPTVAGKVSMWYNNGTAGMNLNGHELNRVNSFENRRPVFVPYQEANVPLLYDLGISELINPSYTTPMSNRPGSITVRLKNFGALTANAIRISYSIDDGAVTGHYDWSGTLTANQTANVVIANSNINLIAGFHTLRVWVEDTLRAGSAYYRDHEPYNDTAFSQFVVCDGPMNGSRTIGGTSPDFNNIEELLYALSRCGVDDSLIVNLAPGQYPSFTMPVVPGLSATNYIVFRPLGTSGSVIIYSDNTMGRNSIVNLEQVSNIRFRDIKFVRRSGSLADMVTLGANSANCYLERCTFIDSVEATIASMRINYMVNSGFANGMVVDGCTFTGGRVGVGMRGQASDMLSMDNTVKNSLFYNQDENAVVVQNQHNPVVERNEMYDVATNTSYVLLLHECYGATRILSNKIYTSHGAGGIGVSNVIGTSALHALIANNMIVNNDNGQSYQMTTPLNVIQATWTDVVYNSVKMTAPGRSNAPTATFGGGTLNNSRFVNNVIVCLDNNNYALNFSPMTSTTNTVNHNVYYAVGGTLCRRSGQAYANIDDWRADFPADAYSISTNPNFLNGSLVDLRTYNRLVKGVGMPMATVPTDMFDSLRSTTATCPGAFEFVSLGYDFEPEALVSPELETCYMPASVELAVLIRNSGVNPYTTSGLSLAYQVNGGTITTIPITTAVPAEDTITIRTGRMLSLPPNGKLDATYTIRVWTTFANDPNQTNDTNVFTVISRYHPVTPTTMNVTPNYATVTTITPTAGIESWAVYNHTSAPARESTIYWYKDSLDAEPFHVGPSFTTDTLRTDTVFYIKQRRNMPIVRITQIEFSHANTVQGLTPNMPYWINANRKVALQLTNIGDATAYLEGDTIQTISPTANLHNKVYTFGDVSIEPGQSLVVQFVGGTSANPAMTVHTGSPLSSLNVSWSSPIAYVYRRGGVIEDLVALNLTSNSSNWSTLSKPSYVWTGQGVTIGSNNVGGLIRQNFNGNALDWRAASSARPMFLNTNNPEWIRYTDNGCEGLFGTVNVNLMNAPLNDLHLHTPVLPDPQCAMGNEDVTISLHNYGVQPVSALTLNYCAGGDTVSETINTGIPANGVITHTFAQQLDMAFDRDSVVTVKVWATALPTDATRWNDTAVATTTSFFTPDAPVPPADRVVQYAHNDTIAMVGSASLLPNLVPVWYDYNMQAVDTGYTHITDVLYASGTMGVSYMVTTHRDGIIGTGTNQSGDADPNPYNIKQKNARQQYLYSPSELRAAGLRAGPIDAIHFQLATVGNNATQTLTNYTIGLGSGGADTIFSANNDWRQTQQCFSASELTLNNTQNGSWVRHAFSQPYEWDGESSLVVEVAYSLPAAVNNGCKVFYSTKPSSVLYKLQSSAITPTTAGNAPSAKRPNIMFDTLVYGCVGPMSTFNVTMTNIPPVDMALYWPPHVDTIHYNSCDSIPIYINLRNQGSTDRNGATVYYYLDSNPVDSLVLTSALLAGSQVDELLFKEPIGPGRHTVRAIVSASGDQTSSNDTIVRSFIVHFCRGTYTIALSGGDYGSFGEAIDTLNVAGIEGPVVFQVADGTYAEQVVLNTIKGSNDSNTITFAGTGTGVLLTAATTQAANYVMQLDSASNIVLSNFRIEARPASGNYANALVMRKGGNITLDSMTIRVKSGVNSGSASCIVLDGDLNGVTITNSVIDSGYCSVRSFNEGLYDILLANNTLSNFYLQGISLREVTNIEIASNRILSAASANNRPLTGVFLKSTTGNIHVKKNHIYLLDNYNGAKRGISLSGITATSTNPAFITNNMVSTNSTYATNQTSYGIQIDTASSYVTAMFNSVRVTNNGTTASNDRSFALFTGPTVSGIQVMNNILANLGKGYAYSVAELNTVVLSNYNGYYSESATPLRWKDPKASLSAMQAFSGTDANSLFTEPYFMAEDDLHLLMTNFVALAQPNDNVTDDIDGKLRPIIPPPTIGAHEMDIKTHDVAVVRIIAPSMPASTTNFSATNLPPNVESDDVHVVAQFYNNGQSTETNVQWYAYIEGYEAETTTPMRSLGTMQPSEMKRDSMPMPTPLGIVDTNKIHVVVVIPVDSAMDNNNVSKTFYLAPAYDLEATRMSTSTTTPTGCYMHNTTVSITLTNKGFKTIPAGTSFNINYQADLTTANVTVPTLPATAGENVSLSQDLYIGNNTTIAFATPANLYPTGLSSDISVRVKGWVSLPNDIINNNDTTGNSTTASPTVASYYTPAPPVGYDTIIPYGSWGAVRASQVNGLAIKWYRDSTAAPFYQPSGYLASTRWSNTPQYFDDSIYYLACRTNRQCQSHFSQVHVSVEHGEPNDIAFESVLAPLGNRVYMEDDTVRVRIANYGSNPQSNIPITYQLKRGANILQEVTETCPATIASGQSADYTFTELLSIPTPTQNQNYILSIWTDLTTDGVRRNDTIRVPHTFRSLSESTYAAVGSAEPTFDITRVSYNDINIDLPALGRGLNNMASYTAPDYPVLRVMRGTTDSLIVEVSQLNPDGRRFRIKGWAMIDFDRSGTFTSNEVVMNGNIVWDDERLSTRVTIPNSASYGYMRMRICVGSNADFTDPAFIPYTGIPSTNDGHTMDFLLYVDANPTATDLSISQILNPRSYLIRSDQPVSVSFRISNKGSQPLDNPLIYFRFDGDTIDDSANGSVRYDGTLLPGTSGDLTLPAHNFPIGTSTLTLWHSTEGDTIRSNDTLVHEYHRFHTVELTIEDNFDSLDLWYAPTGYNEYSRNYWVLGTPNKSRIAGPNSEPNAWVTGLTGNISTGHRGNASFLYSPIIDISQIRPDTLSFYLRRNLINNSSLHLEFMDYEGKWVKVDQDSTTNWYNNSDKRVFDATSSGAVYTKYWIATASFSGDFQEKLQFRFVYTTPISTNASQAFGEGCAIDDIRIGRAPISQDVGVIDIIEPAIAQYGRTYYPKVVVQNYGLDTVRTFQMGYTTYGSFLSRESFINKVIAPGDTGHVSFDAPFVVTNDFPEEFDITAYTRIDVDIYRDNDTATRHFSLSPLDDDISVHEFLYPLENIIAGDTAVQVTMRIRNFGRNPISTATATYIVNGASRIDEVIDFASILGQPLGSLEYFNYTFQQRLRAPMGVMKLTGIIKSDQNEYIYNDTITKQVRGVSSVIDLAAASVVVDETDQHNVYIQVKIDNRGARGANGFTVGYIIDDDTNTMVTETYSRQYPLQALNSSYYMFNATLPRRAMGYPNVLCFVSVDGDNDPSNDSTKVQQGNMLDLEATKVLVEETGEPDCKVRLQVVNRGSLTFANRTLNAETTINGNRITANKNCYIRPGDTMHIEFTQRIPKSPTRSYSGTGKFNFGDINPSNNQTSVVEVVNHFEGVPVVLENQLQLDQNYPNPFTGQTTIPFVLPNAAKVRFFIIDAMGHMVHSFERHYEAGPQTLSLDMGSYTSGVYFYGIEVDGQRRMKKMILR